MDDIYSFLVKKCIFKLFHIYSNLCCNSFKEFGPSHILYNDHIYQPSIKHAFTSSSHRTHQVDSICRQICKTVGFGAWGDAVFGWMFPTVAFWNVATNYKGYIYDKTTTVLKC